MTMKNLLGGSSILFGLVCGIASIATLYDIHLNESDLFQTLWAEAGYPPLAEGEARIRGGITGGGLGFLGVLLTQRGYRMIRR